MRASCVPVLSLPSENAENVPAPPSPNCTLHSGSNGPPARNAAICALRVCASGPRSSTMGRAPARASSSAANIPAGPKPTITGRVCGGAMRGMG